MNRNNYIDLFAGCGGLSLGLHYAGWNGEFAVEKDGMAFETLSKNMIGSNSTYPHFVSWPHWLPKSKHNIKDLLADHEIVSNLQKMQGSVKLIAGGPPCQGFSIGGARKGCDERNELVFDYLEFVSHVKPDMVLIENVEGMARPFKSKPGEDERPILDVIIERLDELGYKANYFVAKAIEAGVPQDRRRLLTFGVKRQLIGKQDPADLLEKVYSQEAIKLKEKLGLNTNSFTTIGEALHDLAGDNFVPCPDAPKFNSSTYTEAKSVYAKLMRRSISDGDIPDSHRFSNHGEKVLNLYKAALATQKPGRLSKEFLTANNTKTQKKFLYGKDIYSATLTTHPDENIHYKFPRNVSLREMARIQSFPDDYRFYGRYTLNGERRKLDVSRCAQIGNAVPPLMANAIGSALAKIHQALITHGELVLPKVS